MMLVFIVRRLLGFNGLRLLGLFEVNVSGLEFMIVLILYSRVLKDLLFR